MKSRYVPIPVMHIASILGQMCFACIFSVEILGKNTVRNIPIDSTKIGWNDSVSNTSPTGASIYAKATIAFPDIYKASFKKFNDKIPLELLFIDNKKFSR